MLVVLDIKNESKLDSFLNFIKTLDYVELKTEKNESDTANTKHTFKEFVGLWKDRDIDRENLREKAWQR